jgi:MFS family permease
MNAHGKARGALGYRDFRMLWSSSLCSWFGQWVQQTTLGWVVYDITGSAAMLGAVLAVRAIPIVLLTPLSGMAADTWNRQRLLKFSQLFAGAVAFGFAALLWLDAVTPWWLFTFTLLMGASNVMDRPARMTSAFELVPREVRMRAVALNTTSFSLMRILGPATAGYIIVAVGAAGCFLLQAMLYLASASVISRTAFPARATTASGDARHGMILQGFVLVLQDRQMRTLLALGALPFFLLVPVWGTLLPLFARDVFVAGPRELGWLLTAVGLGGTLGGLLAHRTSKLPRQGLLQVAWISIMCLAIAALGASISLPWALLCVGVAGVAEMAHSASNAASLQMSAPEALRGRISSLLMLNPSLISLGALLAGPLAQMAGVRSAAFMLSGIGLVALSLMVACLPAIRRFEVK